MCFLKEKLEVAFKTEPLAYLPVYANLQQLINVMDNLEVTSNQLCYNNDCYDKVRRNSRYGQTGRNNCYNGAGRIGILLRILQKARGKNSLSQTNYLILLNIQYTVFIHSMLRAEFIN